MKSVIIIIAFISICFKSFGQSYYGQSWITGGGNSYKVKFENQQRNISVFDTNYNFYFHLGSSCISDSNGNLRIICDGYNLMDSMGNLIDNGDTLVPKLYFVHEGGWSIYSQSSIILPFADDIYYIITPAASDYEVTTYWNNPPLGRALFDLLLYHKVDMKLNGGAGKVVKKAIPLLENVKLSKTQMMACRHANGVDWWLLKQAHDTNMVYRLLVTKDSIYNYGTQGFAEPHFTKWDLFGQIMFNQEGTKYATTSIGINQLFTADFDRCTGQLTSPKTINIANHQNQPLDTTQNISSAGLCFSPNGNFIYIVKAFNLFQYEWNEPDSSLAWYHIANLDTTWAQFQKWTCAYLGPDNKVYIGNLNGLGKAMSVIDNPDIKGAGCGFCPKCFQFPKIGSNTPPCMPNYELGATGQPCWTLESTQLTANSKQLEVYPNPVNTILFIKTESKDEKELYNSICQLLFSTKTNKIDVSLYSKGIYYLKVGIEIRKVMVD